MIFKCNLCADEMKNLRTPGDEINDNLICPDCANEIKEALDQIKKIKTSIHHLIANPN